MRTVSTDELPSSLDVLVASDDESRKHDHYNKYRGGVEWECELQSKQARMGCYSDMLKRMRGMLPREWTVSKPEHNPENNTTTAKIAPQENVDEPNMKSNMTEEKLRRVIREELKKGLNEETISGRGATVEVKEATGDLTGAYMRIEQRGGGSAHVTLSRGSIRKLVRNLNQYI